MSSRRLAVCSWSLQPTDPEALADRLHDLGIPAVQLALVPLVEDPDWAHAIDVLRDREIAIVSGMLATVNEDYSTLEAIARTGGVRPDETWPTTSARAAAVARVAGAAGIDLVTFHAGFIPEERDDPERGVLLGRLREVADVFGAAGVEVAFETGQETAATLVEALDDLDHPSVGVNFDPANMILYGKGDPVDALRTLAPRVRQIHLKDATPTAEPGAWGSEVPLGEGAVDWPAFFEIACGIEPVVDFVIEREAGADRHGDIVKARDLAEPHV